MSIDPALVQRFVSHLDWAQYDQGAKFQIDTKHLSALFGESRGLLVVSREDVAVHDATGAYRFTVTRDVHPLVPRDAACVLLHEGAA